MGLLACFHVTSLCLPVYLPFSLTLPVSIPPFQEMLDYLFWQAKICILKVKLRSFIESAYFTTIPIENFYALCTLVFTEI